jgi:hypothetical protein
VLDTVAGDRYSLPPSEVSRHGALFVRGGAMTAIDERYAALGGPKGFLGQPVGPEMPTPDTVGRFRHFQGGSIYWHPATDAHEVHGRIRDKWSSLGWETSHLGYPLTDETGTPDGTGRFNHFQGGSIYWHPATDAHEVHGRIRDKWSSLGWETSSYGYPISDELGMAEDVARYSDFQHGCIIWSPTTDAVAVRESVRVHAKLLTAPDIPLRSMASSMLEVYLTAEVGMKLLTIQALNLPALNDLEVGECRQGQTTAEQNELFRHRGSVGEHDVAVYFVRSTDPPLNGCAAHPAGRPSAVVAQGASRWTLAHEVGHVLGLVHVNDNDRLMTGNGTGNITNPPPDLVTSEAQTMLNSPLTI